MADLSTEDLARAATRINRLLLRFDALPRHALYYRLGEVGQRRLEPHLVSRALRELVNNLRPRRGQAPQGPWYTAHQLYVSPERTLAEAEELGDTASKNLLELTQLLNRETTAELAHVLSADLYEQSQVEQLGDPHVTSIARDLDVVTDSHVARITRPLQRPVHVWFTHEQDWLYPNDARLWAFLEKCLHEGAGAVVVARKLPLMSFALFKALGIRGVQYFSTLVADELLGSANEIRAGTGWGHVTTISRLRRQPFAAQLESAVMSRSVQSASAQVNSALARAIESGFPQASWITPALVVTWWDESGLDYPRPARTAMDNWSVWDAYRTPVRRPARRHTPDGTSERAHVREVRASTAAPETMSDPTSGFGRNTSVARIPIRGY